MAGKQDGIALPCQRLDPLHHPQLVPIVQAAGRLVHDQQAGLLRQRPGDQHQLLLPAGKLPVAAALHPGNAHLGQRLPRNAELPFSGALQSPHLMGRAHQHHLQYGIVEGRGVGLRDIGHQGGHFPRGKAFALPPGDGNTAPVAAVQPQQAAEQGAFPGAVGAQHGNQLALSGGKIHPVQHFIFSVGKAHVFRFDHRVHTPPPFWFIR